MLTTVLSLLLALGLLASPADWDNLTPQQQGERMEIVVDDVSAS